MVGRSSTRQYAAESNPGACSSKAWLAFDMTAARRYATRLHRTSGQSTTAPADGHAQVPVEGWLRRYYERMHCKRRKLCGSHSLKIARYKSGALSQRYSDANSSGES